MSARPPVRVVCVIGTRPEAIKMAPVVRELARYARIFDTSVCATAQHRDMLDQHLEGLGLKADYDLDVMTEHQTPGRVAAAVLSQLEPLIASLRPDWVLVQGDTTSAMAAALASFHCHVKVAHVEAGLRSGSQLAPFPEEANRRLISVLTDLHFAPTDRARDNLLREGVPEPAVIVTGNTTIDSLFWARDHESAALGTAWQEASSIRTILVTLHRRENLGEPALRVFEALRELALTRGKDIRILYPVHPNPAVRASAHATLSGLDNAVLCSPLGYRDLVQELANAHVVLTDSGGLQEEGPALGKPVLVARVTTERPEAVEIGAARLVGTSKQRVLQELVTLLDDEQQYKRMACAGSPYGDGLAAQRIVAALARRAGVPAEDLPREVSPFVPDHPVQARLRAAV